jgi:hypothetical protein
MVLRKLRHATEGWAMLRVNIEQHDSDFEPSPKGIE